MSFPKCEGGGGLLCSSGQTQRSNVTIYSRILSANDVCLFMIIRELVQPAPSPMPDHPAASGLRHHNRTSASTTRARCLFHTSEKTLMWSTWNTMKTTVNSLWFHLCLIYSLFIYSLALLLCLSFTPPPSKLLMRVIISTIDTWFLFVTIVLCCAETVCKEAPCRQNVKKKKLKQTNLKMKKKRRRRRINMS